MGPEDTPLDDVPADKDDEDATPDWSRRCIVCGNKPVFRPTGMCGPCTFGDADTVGGNW